MDPKARWQGGTIAAKVSVQAVEGQSKGVKECLQGRDRNQRKDLTIWRLVMGEDAS